MDVNSVDLKSPEYIELEQRYSEKENQLNNMEERLSKVEDLFNNMDNMSDEDLLKLFSKRKGGIG